MQFGHPKTEGKEIKCAKHRGRGTANTRKAANTGLEDFQLDSALKMETPHKHFMQVMIAIGHFAKTVKSGNNLTKQSTISLQHSMVLKKLVSGKISLHGTTDLLITKL